MKARPILFSPEMVRALLAGRKTQTRRVIAKPEYYGCLTGDCPHDHKDQCAEAMAGFCHYGAVGDLLYVREAHYIIGEHPGAWSGSRWTHYRADASNNLNDPAQWSGPWKPGIHMPRAASRLTLRVTDVRVQRLQEITWDDAIAEGVQPGPRGWQFGYCEPRSAFGSLWDSINAERGYGWNVNPWVWCLSFSVIKQNVDAYIYARGTGLQEAV